MSRLWTFSKEVNDAFAGAKDLDVSSAAHLDEDLTRSPSNLTARLTLLAYSRTASDLDALQIRLRQLLWFASNQPKHEVLAGPFASPDPRVAAGTDEYKQIRQVWLKHLADEPKDPGLLNHSSNFLRLSDPATVESALQSGIDEADKAAVFQGDL